MKIMTEKQFEMELAKERDRLYAEQFQNSRIENLERSIMELNEKLDRLTRKVEPAYYEKVYATNCEVKMP